MNTPIPPVPGPVTMHPAQPVMPTFGSIIGSALGAVIVSKTGLQSDPVVAGTVVSGTTAFFTGLFHWLGTKLGVSFV
jgi:cobalamin synthase